MWSNESYGPDHQMSATEKLESIQRARRERGLPDYALWCNELIAWVSRGSLSAEGAAEWLKLWTKGSI
jgi:hypothetical protein